VTEPQAGWPERRFTPLLAATTGLALVLRLAWVRAATREPQGLFDPARYVGYARVIADGQGMVEPWSGHPTAYYPPGYPWFLGALAWLSDPVTDRVWLVAALVQAVLGAATVVLGALVARRLAGAGAGLLAGLLLAVYPNLVFHSGAILGETLYIFGFLAFTWIILARPWPDGLGPGRVVAAGVVLGAAILVRPISLAVVPVVVGAWWLADRHGGRTLRRAGVLLAGLALVIVPWTVRNALRMDAFVPMSTNTGDNLCIGHGPEANGAFGARPDCATEHSILDGPAAEIAADREKTEIALRSIARDPGREPWLLWRRFWFMWIRDGDHDGLLAVQSYRTDPFLAGGAEASLARVADLTYWGVALGGTAGLVLLVRRGRPEDLFWVGAAVMTAAVPLAFFGDSRFKVPVIPLLIVAAATVPALVAGERASGASDGSGAGEVSEPTGGACRGSPD
jgi:4-amino-4-deoxy-L-arabinose transferase-like glycosyltransferase